jgi:hypothetical protein
MNSKTKMLSSSQSNIKDPSNLKQGSSWRRKGFESLDDQDIPEMPWSESYIFTPEKYEVF